MNRRLKIAFATAADPMDRRSWSGSTYHIAQALQRHVGDIDCLGPIHIPLEKVKNRLSKWMLRFSAKRYYPTRTRSAAGYYAKSIQRQLKNSAYDLIVAPAASVEIALLKTELPIVYISDATYALMKDVYPIFSQMSLRAAAAESFFEQTAVKKAALLVYASHWALESAVKDYKADEGRIRVIPFGANIDNDPDRNSVTDKHIGHPINMLFLAKEWERKGGPIAVETLNALLEKKVDARLTVCGVTPPSHYHHAKMEVIPYLNKNIPADRERFEKVLHDAHLLLVPSRAECYGVVFCEANAYGLPVFAARVGGIPSIIKDGCNGYLLPLSADGKEYADLIAQSVGDSHRYASLNRGALSRYAEVLNWDSWGMAVRRSISEVVGL